MEIKEPLALSAQQHKMIVMHSALNVLNVILYELLLLKRMYGRSGQLDQLNASIFELRDKLMAGDQLKALTEHLAQYRDQVFAELASWEKELQKKNEAITGLLVFRDNLESILNVMEVRIRELAARADSPDAWERVETGAVVDDLRNVLRAVERNSKGRYRIVYNIAEKGRDTYLIHLAATSADGQTVYMPVVLRDIMRDLTLNARKYTPVGGRIDAGMYDDGCATRFVVTDSGRGIPEDEVERIMQFGERGSNVQGIPTRGGGFGLTKAYYYTKLFGGRFWIESSPENGTRVELWIPYPEKA